ncbi:TetR/AcrR family transcriptional regulator [Novosphingobium sp.]|uniref:TetR/AcrR family transcriptional regulator n=1 Tax=Novosphingobium sp. TaxID=1874826 RepID=UPI0031CF4CCB
MARPKEFDSDTALDAAIEVFRAHGFAGTSAGMLTQGMKIGRQSLYDTFGDKWRLYVAAVGRYSMVEVQAHLDALRGGPTAWDGLFAMIERVVEQADRPCLGVGSICEFGDQHEDLLKAREAAGRMLTSGMVTALREAQAAGQASSGIDPEDGVAFLNSSIAGIRIAARGGAGPEQLRALGRLALRAIG